MEPRQQRPVRAHRIKREVNARNVLVPDRGHARGRVRRQHVIGIEEENYVARGGSETRVDRAALAPVFFQYGANAVAVIREDATGVVGRTVVHDDDFGIGMRLGQRAIHRIAQETTVIPVSDDDAELQLHVRKAPFEETRKTIASDKALPQCGMQVRLICITLNILAGEPT